MATVTAMAHVPAAICSPGAASTQLTSSFRGTAVITRLSQRAGSQSVLRRFRNSARVVAETSGASSPPPLQTPPDFGKGNKGAWFGFGPRQELNVGRLAMIGFASALTMEVLTGKGVFGQLGLDPITVRFPALAGLSFLLVGGLLGGYVIVNYPPDFAKAPPNLGDGVPRNPFDKEELDRLPTYTRGGIVDKPDGMKAREPYVSDLKPRDK